MSRSIHEAAKLRQEVADKEGEFDIASSEAQQAHTLAASKPKPSTEEKDEETVSSLQAQLHTAEQRQGPLQRAAEEAFATSTQNLRDIATLRESVDQAREVTVAAQTEHRLALRDFQYRSEKTVRVHKELVFLQEALESKEKSCRHQHSEVRALVPDTPDYNPKLILIAKGFRLWDPTPEPIRKHLTKRGSRKPPGPGVLTKPSCCTIVVNQAAASRILRATEASHQRQNIAEEARLRAQRLKGQGWNTQSILNLECIDPYVGVAAYQERVVPVTGIVAKSVDTKEACKKPVDTTLVKETKALLQSKLSPRERLQAVARFCVETCGPAPWPDNVEPGAVGQVQKLPAAARRGFAPKQAGYLEWSNSCRDRGEGHCNGQGPH